MKVRSKRMNEPAIEDKKKKKRSPGSTLESRENYLIRLASIEAEKQIKAGNASSQLLTHFLKQGSLSEKLQREKLEAENKLLLAKVEALQSQKRVEVLYQNALAAMKTYSGRDDND